MTGQERCKNRKKIVRLSLVMGIVTAVIVGPMFGYYYSSNDDIMLHNLMSGAYTGRYEVQLVYIMYALGALFRVLYSLLPNVDWYGVFVTVGPMSCAVYGSYRLANVAMSKKSRVVFLCIVWVTVWAIGLKYIMAYQYTTFAGVIVAISLICIVTFEYEKKWKEFAWIAIAIIFSFLLRKQIFILAVPLLLFSVFIKVIIDGSYLDKGKVRFAVKAVAMLISAVAVLFIVEKIAYSSNAWKEYLKFNEARTSVYDYAMLPEYGGNENFFDSIGINEAEYTALKQMDIELVQGVDTQLLETVSEKQKLILEEWKQFYNVPLHFLKMGASGFLAILKTPAGIVFCTLTLLSLLYSLIGKRMLLAICSLVPFVFDFFVAAYFVNLNRFPERVYFPLLLMSIVPVAYMAIRFAHDNKWMALFFCVLLIPLMVCQIKSTLIEKQSLEAKADYWEDLNTYFAQHPDSLWILDSQVYASTAERMFSDVKESDNVLRLSTWLINSPNQKKREEYVGNREKSFLVVPDHYSVQWIDELLGGIDEDKIIYRQGLKFIEVKYPFFE